MDIKENETVWTQFLAFLQKRCSAVEYANWIEPIQLLSISNEHLCLEVPNIFVQEYLLDNYKEALLSFFPTSSKEGPKISFEIKEGKKEGAKKISIPFQDRSPSHEEGKQEEIKLNINYTFENFIEGASNQFIKSAALGVASRPGKSYNPFFIHGGVGLGKTHLLHAIAHYAKEHHKKLRFQCITTEGFINDLVFHLRNKSIDKMKKFYRSLDLLLVDDIQFLQSRLNFEEEFCNTFEALIHQSKQIVITSDKPPGKLHLSERMIARMEWGLVAHIGTPDLETRVAILQHKAEQKGLKLTHKVAFYIAEHIYNNVRQLEGAVNRLGAYCRMMSLEATQEVVESTLREMFQPPHSNVSLDKILQSVASMYNVRESELKGDSREKKIAFPRHIAMYLAKELLGESLTKIASAFGGKKHSTLFHAWKKISKELEKDETLRRRIEMTRQNIES
ncbi:MAG: chromosomal replication initiator protein DnaA [Simkania negevensis]|nr:chromosomal replication initiator protein DnaA [Simkania negevensis]